MNNNTLGVLTITLNLVIKEDIIIYSKRNMSIEEGRVNSLSYFHKILFSFNKGLFHIFYSFFKINYLKLFP